MTRPRRALGTQPGRLAATMLRALAAELSDPGRFSRAKSYARDGAVVEIDIREGEVSGEVFGSRRDPYVVTIFADGLPSEELAAATAATTPVMLVPEPAELEVVCTCPDADGGGLGGTVCKHALAVLLVFADEVSIEPELLTRLRSSGVGGQLRQGIGVRPARRGTFDRRLVGRAGSGDAAPQPRQRVDVLAPLSRSPEPIGELPDFSTLPRPPLETPVSAADDTSRLLDEVLAEAVDLIVASARS
ncbi:MAG: SWIM zinc finger family protein [Acidimicrobiales bacterium]